MNSILKHSEINVDVLNIKKKINIGNQYLNYPIKYNNKNLIIQTPIVYLPFGINKFNNKNYIDISFVNSNYDNNMNQFKQIIFSLNTKLKKAIKIKKKFITSYKKSDGFFPDKLRLSFLEDILIYNEAKNLINLDHIKSKIYCKLLICPQFLWEHKNTYGISWNILQVKIYSKPLLTVYSFIDDDINIDKYLKMYKCGVPLQAIKNKMIIDNIDFSVLEKKLGLSPSINNFTPPNIKLKKLKKSKETTSMNQNKLFKITPNDLLNIKLKKSKENKPINKNSSFKITLNDLLNIKLKKTSQNDKKTIFPSSHHFINLDDLKNTIKKIKNQ